MTIFTKQLLEAAAWTFVETFLVTIGPSMALAQVGDWKGLSGAALAAAMSAGAAGVSVIKSAIVKNIGAEGSVFISGGEE